jgi:hypothetical protein
MSDPGDRAPARSGRAALVAVLAGYALSRILFIGVGGIEFDASPLPWFWQFIDPALLRDDALRSLYYLHSQPPLYNAWLAVALKLGGTEPVWLLWLGHIVVGALLHASIFGVAFALSVRPRLAAIAAIAFAFSPASILFESWLFYTYPVATLLIASAWGVHRVARGGFATAPTVVLFALLATIALTRSLFHLVWLAAMIVAIAACARSGWRRVALAGLIPALLVVSLYAKNGLVFGSFSASSWLGMNMARVLVTPYPAQERERLVREGRIDPISLASPFAPLERYPRELREPGWLNDPAAPHHPVHEAPRKSTKAPNFNHVAYLEIARLYQSDALTLLAEAPGRYVDTLATGWLIFGLSPSEYWFFTPNRTRIAGWDRLWNAFVYGVPHAWHSAMAPLDREDRAEVAGRVGYVWILLCTIALGLALHRGIRDLFGGAGERARGLCLLFMVANVLYVAVLGNALDYRENNRIRFLVEPLLVVLIVWAIEQVLLITRPRQTAR